jgi:hypothetical protein
MEDATRAAALLTVAGGLDQNELDWTMSSRGKPPESNGGTNRSTLKDRAGPVLDDVRAAAAGPRTARLPCGARLTSAGSFLRDEVQMNARYAAPALRQRINSRWRPALEARKCALSSAHALGALVHALDAPSHGLRREQGRLDLGGLRHGFPRSVVVQARHGGRALEAGLSCLITLARAMSRILRSSTSDQLSTYQTSSARRRSQLTALRPCTAAQPVMPGRTSWRRACAAE